MGELLSKLATLFSEPWRVINWGGNEEDLQDLKDYRPQTEGQQLRILLVGPVGAGKSSFINSVQSILRGRMFTQAQADNYSAHSFTTKYTAYKIPKKGHESVYPFVICDSMGLTKDDGVLVDDIKLALRGHVKDGYTFNPKSMLQVNDQFYESNPTSNSKVHVLVVVIPADIAWPVNEIILQKLRDIRKEASSLDIPQVAIFTKIDQFSKSVKENVRNVYKDVALKKRMETFSSDVGTPMNCIFPVKNYHSEIELNGDVDTLILSAMKNIINYGDDYINFKKSSERLIFFGTDSTVRGA